MDGSMDGGMGWWMNGGWTYGRKGGGWTSKKENNLECKLNG